MGTEWGRRADRRLGPELAMDGEEAWLVGPWLNLCGADWGLSRGVSSVPSGPCRSSRLHRLEPVRKCAPQKGLQAHCSATVVVVEKPKRLLAIRGLLCRPCPLGQGPREASSG